MDIIERLHVALLARLVVVDDDLIVLRREFDAGGIGVAEFDNAEWVLLEQRAEFERKLEVVEQRIRVRQARQLDRAKRMLEEAFGPCTWQVAS